MRKDLSYLDWKDTIHLSVFMSHMMPCKEAQLFNDLLLESEAAFAADMQG